MEAASGLADLDAADPVLVGQASCAEAGRAGALAIPRSGVGGADYKITGRLGRAAAAGPITQGPARPPNDLSRGRSGKTTSRPHQ